MGEYAYILIFYIYIYMCIHNDQPWRCSASTWYSKLVMMKSKTKNKYEVIRYCRSSLRHGG